MKNRNSYVRMAVKIAAGGALGGMIGILISGSNVQQWGAWWEKTESWIGRQSCWIFLLLFLAELGVTVWGYRKIKYLGRQHKREENDEQMERIEYAIEYCSTVYTAFAMVCFLIAMICYPITVNTAGQGRFWINLILFLLIGLIYAAGHIKNVKLIQSIYPEKLGDPSDWNFDKAWLESCDEAEKEIIFQGAYKTYRGMQWILALLIVIAIVGEIVWHTGILVVALVGILWGAMAVMYNYHTLKLQKGKISKE